MIKVTANTKLEEARCPIRNVLDQVMGKWQMLILFSLEDGALRFGEVKRSIGNISQRVLTENLRRLERDGYLTRTVHPGPPLAVSYELTGIGQSLVEVLKPLLFWSEGVFAQVKKARKTYEERIQQNKQIQ